MAKNIKITLMAGMATMSIKDCARLIKEAGGTMTKADKKILRVQMKEARR